MTHISFRRATAVASGFVLVVTLAGVTASSASATGSGGEVCTPSDAWEETIPAQGEPTILVENPDYVPGTDPTLVVRRVQVTTYQLYVYRTSPGPSPAPNGQGLGGQWVPVGEPTTDRPSDPVGKEFWSGGKLYYWDATTDWKITTETMGGSDPIGEPMIEKPNPDYVPEKTVYHAAVVCPEPQKPVRPVEKDPVSQDVTLQITEQYSPQISSKSVTGTSSTGSSTSSTPVVHVNG